MKSAAVERGTTAPAACVGVAPEAAASAGACCGDRSEQERLLYSEGLWAEV